MTSSNSTEIADDKNGRSKIDAVSTTRFPKKMLITTVVVALLLVVGHWQADNFNEWFNLNPGIFNVLTIVLPLLMAVAWSCWAWFFAKRKALAFAIAGSVVTMLTLYYPDFGGDANIVGWKSRFWQAERELKENASSLSNVDLASTTPDDFPQFLGVHRDSTVSNLDLADNWDSAVPKLIWKQSLGEGWSGFAAVNGFAVTQEQRGSEECVTCYRIETGELMWIHRVPRRYEDITALGKVGPRATPTIDEGRVYVTSATGVLDCLEGATGELIWSVDVPSLVGIRQVEYTNGIGLTYSMEASNLMWGRAASPLIVGDRVVVTAGGPSKDPDKITATLIAFDKKSGKEIWRGGKRMIAYGSPSLATMLGRSQILLVAEDHAVGHDPETGAELWSHQRSGSSSGDANCSQVTLVSDSQLILSKGYNMGGELIELSESDGAIQVTSLKKDPRVLKTKLTSPVVHEGHTYSLSDGYLECVEIESFKRKWKQRGRFGNGQLLLVGDQLLVHSEDGTLYLVDATPAGFKERGSVKTIEGVCWNTLCQYGRKLLVRSEREAACFELP